MLVETTDELIQWQPPSSTEYIGSGLLYEDTTMFVYGRFGTFKTLLAQDMALAMSQGIPWLTFPTSRAKVLVINIEIPKFLYRARIEKKVKATPVLPGSTVYWVTESYFKLDQAPAVSSLITTLNQVKPQVIVIDPWYKTLSGDISETVGVQRILDRLDEIKKKYHVAIVLIGHTRKPHHDGVVDWGLELMGNSHMQNWADTSIAVESLTSKSIRLHFAKSRNATDELPDLEVVLDRQTLRFIV